jgi:PPOX class probable F420-dependent enzyme
MEVADLITPGSVGAFQVGKRMEVSRLADLPDVHRELLDEPVTATLATVNPGGRPQLTPVWCSTDGTSIHLNSKKGRLKDRNLRERPEVTLLLVNPQNAYHWMEIYGRVVEVVDETDPERGHLATESIDDLAQTYLGQRPYPLRDPSGEVRVLYRVEPTKVVTFGPVT